MTLAWILRLALESITAPKEVARELLDLQLGREALMTAFLLVAVLNTLVFSATVMLLPEDDLTRQVLGSPTTFFIFFVVALLITTSAFSWVGRMLGGTGTFAQVATLTIWMQGLRFFAQVVLALLSFASAGLASLAVLIVSALGLWILLNFIDVVHGFGSLGRSAMVLIGAIVGLGLILSVLLSFAGVGSTGFV